MTAARGGTGKASRPGAPERFAQGDPASVRSYQPEWALQILVDIKKDVGVLTERIDRLRDDVIELKDGLDTFGTKVDGINTKLIWVSGICVGVAGIVAIIWAVVTQVPWDKIVDRPDKPHSVETSGTKT